MERMLMQVIAGGTPWTGSCTLEGYGSTWSELRGFSQEAVQEFSGSGSAGIKAATGRVGLNDLDIEKSVDEMSPLIFEHCCSGGAVDTIVIEVWSNDRVRMTLVLDGGSGSTNFSGYKIIGERYFAPALDNLYQLEVPAMGVGGTVSGVTRQQKPGYTVTTKETFKLWFTRIRLQFYKYKADGTPNGTVIKGWHGGMNCPDETAVVMTGGPSPMSGVNRAFSS